MNIFKKYKKTIMMASTIILLAAAAVIYIAATPKEATYSFRYVKAERGNIESLVSSTGVLNPVVTVQVGSQVSGTIKKIYTDFNKKVKKGQLVALIDTTFLAASVRDAQSSVDKAQAQYDQSARELDRTKVLVSKNLAAQTELETAKYNADVARASLRSAQAQLDRARINLKYAAITAPIDGTVIARNVDVGQTVAASLSAPTLFLIANDLSKMQIIANVDESDIGQIKENQKVTFTVQAYPDKTFEGIVQQIRLQPSTVQNVVNYSVVINVNNQNGLLLPGMTATIQFQIAEAENVLKIPNAALRFRATPEMLAEAQKNMGNSASQPGDSARRAAFRAGRQGQASQNGRGADGSAAMGDRGRRNGAVLWYQNNGKLMFQRVRTGLSDGQYTEIKSDMVQEGQQFIAGVNNSEQKSTTANPLQPQGAQGMGGRRGF